MGSWNTRGFKSLFRKFHIMNVLVCGMGRAGSTAVFNIVKILLSEKYGDIYACHESNYDKKNQKKVNLLKTHNKDYDGWADIIITTRRDIRDVMASFKQFHSTYKPANAAKWAKTFINWHQKWFDKSNYEVVYEEFMSDRNKIIDEIANILNVESYNITHINDKIDELKEIKVTKKLSFDKDTLIHKKHISKHKGKVNIYNQILNKNEINSIISVSEEWLKKFNYEI